MLGVGSRSLLGVEFEGVGSELGPASCDAAGWLGGSGIFPTSVGSSAQLARNSINIAIRILMRLSYVASWIKVANFTPMSCSNPLEEGLVG